MTDTDADADAEVFAERPQNEGSGRFPMCAQEAVERLRPDASTQQFRLFHDWTLTQPIGEAIPLFITDPEGDIHQFEFYWCVGGHPFTLENTIFPNDEAMEAADAPYPNVVIALEDNTGEIHFVSPLGTVERPSGMGWILFWALKEREYWIVFNWDEPEDGEYVEDPSMRYCIFPPTNFEFSYCRLSGFNFDNWWGKMENLYKGGFTVRQVTRENGVLAPLYVGIPAPSKEFY